MNIEYHFGTLFRLKVFFLTWAQSVKADPVYLAWDCRLVSNRIQIGVISIAQDLL